MLKPVEIPVEHGSLEGLLELPEGPPFAAAVVCHPHPLHGGTMRNNVVYRVATALAAAGAAALRFNFRGVGRSSGSYGEGVGEREDVRAALDFLRRQLPAVPLWLAGFSFGAFVGLSHAQSDDRVEALLGVGLPLKMYDFSFLGSERRPKAFIQAQRDEFGSAEELARQLESWPEPKKLLVVPEATHLFQNQLRPLEAAAGEALSFLRSKAAR